jgi:hypothetical protein
MMGKQNQFIKQASDTEEQTRRRRSCGASLEADEQQSDGHGKDERECVS